MIKIYRYPLRVTEEQTVRLPRGAGILSVGVHREYHPDGTVEKEEPSLWAMVETTMDEEVREIAIRGTGHFAGDVQDARFLGTVFMYGGRLVVHVFERVSGGAS